MSLIRALLGLLSAFADLFRDKQLIDAGKAEQELASMKEVERHAEAAENAVRAVDPARDERLRNRFDRARSE